MGILLFVLFGSIVGLAARGLLPERQSMGIVTTAVLGMIGALVGGLLGNLLAARPLTDLNAAGFVGSVICAIVLLTVVGANGSRRGQV